MDPEFSGLLDILEWMHNQITNGPKILGFYGGICEGMMLGFSSASSNCAATRNYV